MRFTFPILIQYRTTGKLLVDATGETINLTKISPEKFNEVRRSLVGAMRRRLRNTKKRRH